jgi:hypothetical protein
LLRKSSAPTFFNIAWLSETLRSWIFFPLKSLVENVALWKHH